MNKVLRFLWVLVLICGSTSALSALKGGAWQELDKSTDAINGTVPQADGATIPVYQGSILLTPDKPHQVGFDVMPKNFSVDAASSAMQVVNPLDTEGDIFSIPPLNWENQQPPTVSLVWADAATPDEPLRPQPVANKTFCMQNLAGRHLVVWPQIENSDPTTVPALYLLTSTGTPDRNTLALLQQKIAIDITAAEGEPVAVSADRMDESLQAAKAKVGESITLTVTTQGCDGNPVGNAAFVIRRDDAKNRKGEVNNNHPLRVGDTELTTTATLYRGVTDEQGRATVVVAQPDGPGVKTHLVVSSESHPDLFASVDVVFTTLTSPDSAQAAMYGHMPESASATLNGSTYTFTRPKLAAETSGTGGTFNSANEVWAQFNWNGADNHCDILPDAEQLAALRSAHNTTATYPGWPLDEYWSSTKDQLSMYHYAVNVESGAVVRESDSSVFLTSCVDKAQPLAHPQITLSPQAPYKAEVGESIDIVASVVDEDTQKPLPYRYLELFVDPASNRKGEHKDEWDNLRVVIHSEDMRASSPEHYTGVTDANGQVHLSLSHDSGVGVKTPIRLVMPDDAGGSVTLPFEVTFTVITSPDVDGANMYGHMQGVVDAGNLYKRPLLASEASHKTGQQSENNEEWATFSTVAAATSQCGTGQVPDTTSLEHLYSEHPDNKMLTEHGWPTQTWSYIAADATETQVAHVSLKTGDDGVGSEPNYLTCSANELVAVLDAWFNDDPVLRSADAQVGQQIKMSVSSANALNGQPIANVDFTVTLSPGTRRDGLATGFTDPSKGELLFDGAAYGAGASSMTYQGMTDAQGRAEIILEQPRGVGVSTPLNIVPVDSLIKTPIIRNVKFTVATSPDTPKAKMWGHMPDTLTVGEMAFTRPKLAAEVTATRTQDEDNETWARVLHADTAGNEAAGGCAANRLPRVDQLQALYDANSSGAMHSKQGWPVSMAYWSSTLTSPTTWNDLAMDSGAKGSGGEDSLYTSCLTSDNPAAASITIEPVDPSLWYDGSDVHAVKVKKDDTLQLKVTVKDASGQPLPGAPFILSRGDGYTRQGEKHMAGGGDDIVSPMVIDGESLNDTSTKIGKMTGVDGSKIISVTRPGTHGTRVALTAALYDNNSVSASLDTIFTVITSPDSDKANMWGHMQASLTATDGAVYQRPLLYAELSSTSNSKAYTEDNESWAAFYGPDSGKANPANCASGYYPSVSALNTLYNTYPSRAIKTAQGWPIDRSYWSGSHGQGLATEIPANYYIVDLDDGSRQAVSKASSSNMQYQICAKTPLVQATQILLSSEHTKDAGSQAVKVKNNESIPLVITTTDAAGNLLGNTAFTLRYDAGTARNASYTSWSAVTMLLTQPTQASLTWLSSDTLYGVTGADGTLAVDLSQPNGPGVKNTLTASLYDTPTASSVLPVIFTVTTSPDSDKANMWGHMPETFTASNGSEFNRPQLYSELSSTTDTSTYTTANETWFSVKNFDQGRGACPLAQMATAADYQALYGDHPNGAIATDLGLPVGKSWWSGDQTLQGQSFYWRYTSLKTGKVNTASSTSSNYLQLCRSRLPKMSVTLSLTPWDAEKSAAVVKKGEQVAATVTVTDSGKPVSNVLLKLTRGDALTRAGSIYTLDGVDDITLNDIQPSDTGTYLLDTTSKYLYVQTNALGQVTFTLSQNKGAGLKTPVIASLVDDASVTDSKDAIFTIISSPDSDKAAMWGHMSETVTNSAGTTFHRPLLAAEMSTGVNATYTEDNEVWPRVTKADAETPGVTNCDEEYQPRLADLETLYDDHPHSELATLYGWPVDSGVNWWAVDRLPSGFYQYIRLDTGVIASYSSSLMAAAQVCLTKPHAPLPATIELTSSLPVGVSDAVKMKTGEEIPLTVTIKDDSGMPMANAPFTISRGYGVNRSGETKESGNNGATDDLTLQALTPTATTVELASDTDVYHGVTGASGSATFTLRQDTGMGLKTPISAKMDEYPRSIASLNVIFSVVTSPDSDKAQYWGHMPETVTSSDGTVFKRPLLAAETPTEDSTFSSYSGNELWPLFDHKGASLASESGCPDEYQPSLSVMQTLYRDYPGGELGTQFGWPVDRSTYGWWTTEKSDAYYQTIDLTTGDVNTRRTSNDQHTLVCLANPNVQ